MAAKATTLARGVRVTFAVFIERSLCHHTGAQATNMASTGEPLRRAREARGLTQMELARRAGISRQALGALEAGTYQPGVTVAIALARELGDSVEGLFGGEAPGECNRIRAAWAGHDAPLARGAAACIAL